MTTLLFKEKPFDVEKLLAVAGSCPEITIKSIDDVCTLEEEQANIRFASQSLKSSARIITTFQGKYFPLFNGEEIRKTLNDGSSVKVRMVSSVAMKRAKHLSAEEHAEMRAAAAESARPSKQFERKKNQYGRQY